MKFQTKQEAKLYGALQMIANINHDNLVTYVRKADSIALDAIIDFDIEKEE
ncbi:hypothetical protein KAR91_18035 [Candidatus Pacearchaeota archaeon]|nr:hypothetical protein [Candidatus Pacearchaeota archaeon]